ncbi:MAG: DUF3828 domain-containing protein [Flavobacterium sp.]|uniref:DUF3828 domain-containing protein n=1 Tax=Flavobacterium sp. TaxID=239 RepID=UPI00121587BD|nr:DUF3828 domain-containing protein [Flavobacterium sp.]RZJ68772.1 MAG: DUF3828 domain-containing protein [Flavobacterium sp.]
MTRNLTALFLLLTVVFSASAQKKTDDQQTKIAMLKSFYTEYIIANSKTPIDEKEVDAIKKKYCTAKFLKQLAAQQAGGETDYDIFVSAQDYDIEWLKSLKIEPSATFNVFRVTYDMNFEDDQALIRPVVAKENGKFKIDDIKTD